jgi:hypothetical protein
MVLAKANQQAGHLFGGGDAEVADNAAMEHFRIVRIDQIAGEVGAVVSYEIEFVAIGSGVVFANQLIVLVLRGIDLEAVKRATIGDAERFGPAAAGRLAVGPVGSNGLEVVAAILIAEKVGQLFVGGERDILGLLDGVEIGDERHRDPVVAGNVVVAADDGAQLTRGAAAEDYGRLGADVGQVDGVVPGSGESAVVAVGFFKK